MADESEDFDGCSRLCRKRGEHTRKWGACEHGMRPEPRVGFFRTATGEDGHLYGYEANIPLAALLPWAKHLTVDQRHQMLEEISDAEDPAACVEEWRTTTLSSLDAESVSLRFTREEMRDLRRIADKRGATVDELIREWLAERLNPTLPKMNAPGAVTINMMSPADPQPGVNMAVVAAMYERGRRQGRHEAAG